MADREQQESPQSIIARIEGLIAGMRTASPSGTETLHQKLTVEFENLRAAYSAPAPAPAREEPAAEPERTPAPSRSLSPKAKKADDDAGEPTPGAPSP